MKISLLHYLRILHELPYNLFLNLQADNAEMQKTAEEQLALEAAVKQKTRARKEHNAAVVKAEKDVARRAAEIEKKVRATWMAAIPQCSGESQGKELGRVLSVHGGKERVLSVWN